MRTAKKIARLGMLTALAIVLSSLEQYIPLQTLLPLPGLKLGIANVVTLFALYNFGPGSAMFVLLARCFLSSLMFGTPVSLAMSLCGGILALIVMAILHYFEHSFSLWGISIAGAAMHNIGQTACAAVILQSMYIFAYLPILLLGAFLTGALIAVLCKGLLKYQYYHF